MITGVVLARNEEANIVECLESLQPHVGEIILIDMESTDLTVALAKPLCHQGAAASRGAELRRRSGTSPFLKPAMIGSGSLTRTNESRRRRGAS